MIVAVIQNKPRLTEKNCIVIKKGNRFSFVHAYQWVTDNLLQQLQSYLSPFSEFLEDNCSACNLMEFACGAPLPFTNLVKGFRQLVVLLQKVIGYPFDSFACGNRELHATPRMSAIYR
jgi:hypothetical protein